MYKHIEVFYAYAPEDKSWVQNLEKHLRLLQRQGLISTWHPRLVNAGEDWQHVIDLHFKNASIILLLISPDFLASDYCYSTEMKQALEREREKGVCVIPILLRPVDWENAPFAHLSPLPSDATFLTEWTNLDRAFAEVAVGIRRSIENLSLLTANLMRTNSPRIWNVPFPRNLFFIGREDLLAHLHTQLQKGHPTTLSQAISGLGGVGKTQLAVEYAYRFHQEYDFILWVHAESAETLTSSYTEIAALLDLSVKDSQDQAIIIRAVKVWLQNHENWLLILDNADELDILPPFLPPRLGGHVIITTRAVAFGRFSQRFLVETFPQEQGILFLLRRAGIIALDADVAQTLAQDRSLAQQIAEEVGGLPLALDQIGAYLETTGCGLIAYWQQYQRHRVDLLREYRGISVEHLPVATTWTVSLARVEERNPAAGDLLRLCAFLAPDAIQEDILVQGADTLESPLASIVADSYLFDQAIETLRAYSLIIRDTQIKALTVHRLVQTVIRDALSEEEQKQWMRRAIVLVNWAFPDVEFRRWSDCERCVPHALLCVQWIKQEHIFSPEVTRLMDHLGHYLGLRGHYTEGEQLLQQTLLLYEQQLQPDPIGTATSLYHLALLYRLSGKYAEAEPLFQQSLSIREQQLGPEHPDTAISLNGLASLYERWGKYTQAEQFALRSLAICEQVLGPEHPETAYSLHNLALLYRRQGKYAQAELVALRSLAIREKVLGPEDPYTAFSLHNLALLYGKQEKYAQAEPLSLRSLAIREKVLGPEHPYVAFSLNELAALYVSQGKYIEAEPLYLRAVAINEQQLGPENPDTALSLHGLANLYASQERYVEAEALYLRVMAINEQQLGLENPDTALILYDLATLYVNQGKYKEAKPLYQRALAIRRELLGPEHPDTKLTEVKLGSL